MKGKQWVGKIGVDDEKTKNVCYVRRVRMKEKLQGSDSWNKRLDMIFDAAQKKKTINK